MDAAEAPPFDYNEFGLFHENIAEFELPVGELPPVERVSVQLRSGSGRTVSALRWGVGAADVVFVHGGAQNAHTWDTVALALGRPALAVDLPGHGHSAWRDDGAYTPHNLADDIAVMVEEHAPTARVIVGMSLGGLTSMELAVRHPALVRRLVLVDITPGVDQQKAKAVLDFVDGPQEFASFEDLLDRTIRFNPTRSESSLRRGILHNAVQARDGSWQWRYDRSSHVRSRDETDTNGESGDSLRAAGDSGAATSVEVGCVRSRRRLCHRCGMTLDRWRYRSPSFEVRHHRSLMTTTLPKHVNVSPGLTCGSSRAPVTVCRVIVQSNSQRWWRI